MPVAARVIVFVGLFAGVVAAQPTQPIYLQYDGFVRNADASLTLAFGYYNLNQVDVTIEAGDDNRFVGGAADREQPTVFLAGRHRFTCVMVVRRDADAELRWQVQFAGRTSVTTDRVLDPRYALEAASAERVVAGLDGMTQPPGVCLERAPTVEVGGAGLPARAR